MPAGIFLLEAISCVYIGETLGLFIQCENTNYLRPIRWYCFLVPIVRVALFYSCLKESIEKQRWWLCKYFISSGEITTIILCVFADLQPELREKKRKRRIRQVFRKFNRQQVFSISFLVEQCVMKLDVFAE